MNSALHFVIAMVTGWVSPWVEDQRCSLSSESG